MELQPTNKKVFCNEFRRRSCAEDLFDAKVKKIPHCEFRRSISSEDLFDASEVFS